MQKKNCNTLHLDDKNNPQPMLTTNYNVSLCRPCVLSKFRNKGPRGPEWPSGYQHNYYR